MDIYDPTDDFDDGRSDDLPTIEEFDNHHSKIVEEYDIKYTGVTAHNPRKVANSVFESADEYEDPYMKAAYLLRKLPVAHIYEDGNKRTSWVTVVDYLDRKGLDYPKDPEQIERVMKQIRAFDTEEVASWLETGEIELRR